MLFLLLPASWFNVLFSERFDKGGGETVHAGCYHDRPHIICCCFFLSIWPRMTPNVLLLIGFCPDCSCGKLIHFKQRFPPPTTIPPPPGPCRSVLGEPMPHVIDNMVRLWFIRLPCRPRIVFVALLSQRKWEVSGCSKVHVHCGHASVPFWARTLSLGGSGASGTWCNPAHPVWSSVSLAE